MDNRSFETYITSYSKPFELKLKELFKYKDLIWLFVKRDFTSQYKQTILGPLWFVINPLITTFISTLIFGGIAHIDSDGVPYFLFYLSGYTIWNYFSACVSQTSSAFTANAGIMGKVYFPRLTMPIASVLYSAINMIIVFGMTLITMFGIIEQPYSEARRRTKSVWATYYRDILVNHEENTYSCRRESPVKRFLSIKP